MPARPVWTILLSRDVRSAMDFYRAAVGWSFEPLTGLPYPAWSAKNHNGATVAAFMDMSSSDFPDAPELWLPCFTVTDLERRMEGAEHLGATVLRAPFNIESFGRLAILRQPAGGIVGWRSPPSAS